MPSYQRVVAGVMPSLVCLHLLTLGWTGFHRHGPVTWSIVGCIGLVIALGVTFVALCGEGKWRWAAVGVLVITGPYALCYLAAGNGLATTKLLAPLFDSRHFAARTFGEFLAFAHLHLALVLGWFGALVAIVIHQRGAQFRWSQFNLAHLLLLTSCFAVFFAWQRDRHESAAERRQLQRDLSKHTNERHVRSLELSLRKYSIHQVKSSLDQAVEAQAAQRAPQEIHKHLRIAKRELQKVRDAQVQELEARLEKVADQMGWGPDLNFNQTLPEESAEDLVPAPPE